MNEYLSALTLNFNLSNFSTFSFCLSDLTGKIIRYQLQRDIKITSNVQDLDFRWIWQSRSKKKPYPMENKIYEEIVDISGTLLLWFRFLKWRAALPVFTKEYLVHILRDVWNLFQNQVSIKLFLSTYFFLPNGGDNIYEDFYQFKKKWLKFNLLMLIPFIN